MDDNTLAPFVDALASALIMMVLVAVFFLLQSITSIAESAKLYTVSPNTLEEKKFSPIFFHKALKVNLEKNEILYMSNFDLTPEELDKVKQEISEATTEVKLTIQSNDSDTKTTANLLRFLGQLDLPSGKVPKIIFAESESTISKIIWEF